MCIRDRISNGHIAGIAQGGTTDNDGRRVMRLKASRSSGGKHRTITTSQTKGRLALVAVAVGTVSSGVGGATAATLQAPAEVEAPVSPEAATVEVDLATNDTALSSSGTQAAPQILAISEFKPVANIDEQLDKAIQYNAERAEDLSLIHI